MFTSGFLDHGICPAAFFEQISNGSVGASGFGGQADFASAVGGYPFAAIRRQSFVYFAQRVDVEFRHAESAAIDPNWLDNLLDTSCDHAAQLGVGGRATYAAINMQRDGSGFAGDH